MALHFSTKHHLRRPLAALCTVLVAALAANAAPVDYAKAPKKANTLVPEKTRYDYAEMARKLTNGCHTDYERAAAIYKWICDNIAYDTSFKIRTADKCMQERKGVCQAYCELYSYMAAGVGLNVEVVNGQSKDYDGSVSPNGHSWLFVYTNGQRGILVDPTWGAGEVSGTEFVRSLDCWPWFNVDPEWMILSHLPDDASYQLLPQSVSPTEFASLPPMNELWLEYGLKVHDIYRRARANTLAMPTFYNLDERGFRVVSMPMEQQLQIGETYTFSIRVPNKRHFAIINGSVFCQKDEWTSDGDSIFTVTFMPRDTGKLSISLKDAAEGYWSNVVSYDIAPPTQANWDKVEKVFPQAAPELQTVANFFVDKWQRAGLSAEQMVQIIREQNITELPLLFDEQGQQFTVVSIPMHRTLAAGTPYTFSFYPRRGLKWAVVNGQTWFRQWDIDPADNRYSQTVTPQQPGPLYLFVQMEDGQSYWSALEYVVQ